MTLENSVLTLQNALTRLPQAQVLAQLNDKELLTLWADWQLWARPDQLPSHNFWRRWLVLGGRGSGKTRTGAEHIRALVKKGISPICLIGETFNEVREVMIEGVSGLKNISPPDEMPLWEATRRRLVYPSGAICYAFSAEDPESLRGPQFAYAWIDEFAKFKRGQEVMDMLSLGLRLGENPRMVITTTPRPVPHLKRLIEDKSTLLTTSKTSDNTAFLAKSFMEEVQSRYGGTRLGRQELEGELIEDRADALWSRQLLEECRIKIAPLCKRVVVAVDPPGSSLKGADKCGLVVVGLTEQNLCVVLEDATLDGLKPFEWAGRAVRLYHKHQADKVIAEVNQGGEMVTTILKEIDNTVLVEAVRATRGKYLRAEPVAALYQQGRVQHFGTFPELEDELCDFTPDGLSNKRSPDRLDALVWAVHHLLLKEKSEPRVRAVF